MCSIRQLTLRTLHAPELRNEGNRLACSYHVSITSHAPYVKNNVPQAQHSPTSLPRVSCALDTFSQSISSTASSFRPSCSPSLLFLFSTSAPVPRRSSGGDKALLPAFLLLGSEADDVDDAVRRDVEALVTLRTLDMRGFVCCDVCLLLV